MTNEIYSKDPKLVQYWKINVIYHINRLKKKSFDHINWYAKKLLTKFNNENSLKNRNRGEFPQFDKEIYKRPAANIALNDKLSS